MNEEFEKLFSTLSEKDQKEVANLIRFKNEVKYHDKQFEELLNQYIELSREHDKLQNNWNELKKFVEEEKNRLATQVSNTYEDSLSERRFVNEDIFNELTKVSEKMQELERGKE